MAGRRRGAGSQGQPAVLIVVELLGRRSARRPSITVSLVGDHFEKKKPEMWWRRSKRKAGVGGGGYNNNLGYVS